MKQERVIRILVMCLFAIGGSQLFRLKHPLTFKSFPPWLLLFVFAMQFLFAYIHFRQKYVPGLPCPSCPDLDAPLMKEKTILQNLFDNSLFGIGFGLGGLIGVYAMTSMLSVEAMVGLVWSVGSMLSIPFVMKQWRKLTPENSDSV